MSSTSASTPSCSLICLQPRPSPWRLPPARASLSYPISAICFGSRRVADWRNRRGNLCVQVHSSSSHVDAPGKLVTNAATYMQNPSNLEAKPHFEVKLHEATMVKPSTTTVLSTASSCYFLSNLDIPLVSVSVNLAFFFPGDATLPRDNLAQVMKEALERALVHYYPLAGRIALDPLDGRPFVDCNDQGVCFAVGDASIDIADLGDLDLPESVILAPLFYRFPGTVDNIPLLNVQMTRFMCGGYVLGVEFQHCMCDGAGLFNFLNSWAECVRGMPLSLPPVLDRTFLKARTPLQVSYSHPEYTVIDEVRSFQPKDPTHCNVLRSFRFTPSSLVELRKKAMEDGLLPKCSAFEALSGLLWKVRTTAMGMDSEQKVKVTLAVDGRLAKGGRFPRGYLGNATTVTAAIATAHELEGKPLAFAVKHVQDAVKSVTGEYIRSQVDYLEREGMRLPSFRATTAISLWSRLSLYDLEFGFGKPTHVIPVSVMLPEVIVILAYGEGRKGMNVLLCHPLEVQDKVDELLHPYVSPVNISRH